MLVSKVRHRLERSRWRESKPRITCVGYYGQGNFGDDLFVEVMMTVAKKAWSVDDIQYIGNPVVGHEEYVATGCFGVSLQRGQSRLQRLVVQASILIRTILTRDVVVVAGGSLFSSSGSYRLIQSFSWAARMGFVELVVLGVSIGPFTCIADEQRALRAVSSATVVAVRDSASATIASDWNLGARLIRSGDLAVALFSSGDSDRIDTRQPVLGVSVCQYESIVGGTSSIEADRVEALISGIVEAACGANFVVRILVLNTDGATGDDSVSARLQDRLRAEGIVHEIVRSTGGPARMLAAVGACSAVLSVRLHGGVAAYTQGIPFALVEYHAKCGAFLDDIQQPQELRLPGRLVDSHAVTTVVRGLLSDPRKPGVEASEYARRSMRALECVPWV